MRKVEFIACRTFADAGNMRCGNTRVETLDLANGQTVSLLYLHDHLVARLDRKDGTLTITDAGWMTVTTKSRLNAVLATLFGPGACIQQRDWQWYLSAPDGQEYAWDGGASFHLGSGKPACELRPAAA